METLLEKIPTAKRAESVALVIEHLPGKHKALSSKTQYQKKEIFSCIFAASRHNVSFLSKK
jgi:hypothetical protein